MDFEDFLTHLEGVKRTGSDRAVAKCPAHCDKTPSLSLRVTEDGTILIKCFAGCGATDVVNAIGLELADLFPDRPTEHRKKGVKPNHWHAAREALKKLHKEVLIVAIAAADIAKGRTLSPKDADRVAEAAAKVREAAEICR
mgnify:FL=1